jgi:uncharacterized membrane protein
MVEIVPNWHPIFVHFTVALLSLAVGLSLVTPLVRTSLKQQWHIVSLWALWFGAGFTVLTALTGLYAYNTVAHDTPSHAAMTEHRNWAVATISLFLALALWSILRVRRKKVLGPLFVIGMVVAGGALASTALRGGELVYRYGLGVMSLPQAEGEGHEHEHADGEGHVSAAGSITNNGRSGVQAQHPDGECVPCNEPVSAPDMPSMTGADTGTQNVMPAPAHHDHHDHEH